MEIRRFYSSSISPLKSSSDYSYKFSGEIKNKKVLALYMFKIVQIRRSKPNFMEIRRFYSSSNSPLKSSGDYSYKFSGEIKNKIVLAL